MFRVCHHGIDVVKQTCHKCSNPVQERLWEFVIFRKIALTKEIEHNRKGKVRRVGWVLSCGHLKLSSLPPAYMPLSVSCDLCMREMKRLSTLCGKCGQLLKDKVGSDIVLDSHQNPCHGLVCSPDLCIEDRDEPTSFV